MISSFKIMITNQYILVTITFQRQHRTFVLNSINQLLLNLEYSAATCSIPWSIKTIKNNILLKNKILSPKNLIYITKLQLLKYVPPKMPFLHSI